MSDAELVLAARQGDRAAQNALVRRYYKSAYRFAFRLMGRERDVDDLVQDCMIRALRDIHQLREPELFWSWLGRSIINAVGKHRRRQRLAARLGLAPSEPVDTEDLVSREAPPDVALELQVLRRVLRSLPEKLRVVLLLRRVEGLPLEDVAQLMDTSLATVKRWLTKATAEMELAMGGKHDGP